MTTFRIGELEISRVEDFIDPRVPVKFLLPEIPDEAIASNLNWLAPRFYDPTDHTVAIHIQSWLIRTAHHAILVDTCGGNHKPRSHFPVFNMRNGPYLENLRAAGVNPEDIDFVFCTHLHIDHVGWNTKLENGRWVPTFPNARYLFSKADYEAFDPCRRPGGEHLEIDGIFEDSVLPVVEAGLTQMVEGSYAINDNLTIEPAPGHSPGHSLLRATSGDDSGLFIGDAMHHPLQIAVPECNSFNCVDPTVARQTRRRILEECCERHRLLFPGHFAAPHCGRIRRSGSGFAFRPGV